MNAKSSIPPPKSSERDTFISRWTLVASLIALGTVVMIRHFSQLAALFTSSVSAHSSAPGQPGRAALSSSSAYNRDYGGDLRAAYARSLKFIGLKDTAEVRRELYRLANPNAASIPDRVSVEELLQCEPIRRMTHKSGNSSNLEFDPMQFLTDGEAQAVKGHLPDWMRSPGDYLRFRRTVDDVSRRMTHLHMVLNREHAKAVDLEPRKTLPWFDAMKLFASASPAYLPRANDERRAVPFLSRSDTEWLDKMDKLFDSNFVSKIVLEPKLQPKPDSPLPERLRLLVMGSEPGLQSNPSFNGGLCGWDDDDRSNLHAFAGPLNVPTSFASMVYGAAMSFRGLRQSMYDLVHPSANHPEPQVRSLPTRRKDAAARQP